MVGTNYQRVVDAISNEFDELYINMYKVKFAHMLLEARGSSLSNLVKVLMQERIVGETDAHLRNRLEYIALANISSATKPAIINYISGYLGLSTEFIEIVEQTPGQIYIKIPIEYSPREDELRTKISAIAAAGIYVKFIYEDTFWDDAHWDTSDENWI